MVELKILNVDYVTYFFSFINMTTCLDNFLFVNNNLVVFRQKQIGVYSYEFVNIIRIVTVVLVTEEGF